MIRVAGSASGLEALLELVTEQERLPVMIQRFLHKVIEGDNPKFETIPNDRDKINTLFTLYQNSGGEDISSLINDGNNEAVLTALMKTFST